MSGVYNQTYFNNHPHEKEREGVLYGVILVNQKTFERECIKVGIASGKDWRHVIKRSRGFKGYDLRIQRTYHDTIYNCWKIEQELHEKFKHDSFQPLKIWWAYRVLQNFFPYFTGLPKKINLDRC